MSQIEPVFTFLEITPKDDIPLALHTNFHFLEIDRQIFTHFALKSLAVSHFVFRGRESVAQRLQCAFGVAKGFVVSLDLNLYLFFSYLRICVFLYLHFLYKLWLQYIVFKYGTSITPKFVSVFVYSLISVFVFVYSCICISLCIVGKKWDHRILDPLIFSGKIRKYWKLGKIL